MQVEPNSPEGVPNQPVPTANVESSTGFKGHLRIKVIRARRNTWWYKLFTLSFLRRQG